MQIADPTIFVEVSKLIIGTGLWVASMIILALAAKKVITEAEA